MSHQPAYSHGRTLRRAIVVLGLFASSAVGQVTRPDTETPGGTSTYLESLESLGAGTQLIHKDPVTGRVQLYPAFSTEWLNALQQRAELQNRTPLYDLQHLKITGSVRDEFVELSVEVQVQISVSDEWVRVPLEFGEFHLVAPAPEHVVLPPAVGTERFEKKLLPAKTWQLRGKGTHQLKFHLIGAIRTDANGRQKIRVTPPVANQSHMLLKLPGIVPAAEISTAKPVDIRPDEVLGISELETWGLTEKTEISWAPETLATDTPTTIQATAPARMNLDVTTTPVSLSVEQSLTISGGSIDSLTVELPTGFTNVEITGTDADDAPIVLSVEVLEDSSVVEFDAPMTGAIVLNYGLELPDNAGDASVRFPKVKGVSKQTADLEAVIPIGLEVDFKVPKDGSVRQKRVEVDSETRAEGLRRVAYRLLSDDAELKLSIREPEAFYSVVPLVTFETEGESVLLTARFSVNVVRGGFNEMTISWPEFESDGWQILDGYTRLITDAGQTNLTLPSDGDNVIVQFPTRQSRRFEIELQALRPLQKFKGSERLLFLPDILTPTPHQATISLIESDAYSMVLRDREAQATFQQLPFSRWPELLLAREEPLTAWLVDSPGQAVQLELKQQQSEVRASLMAEVSVVNDTIHLQETITYDVRHRDIREVQLFVGDMEAEVRLRDVAEPLEKLAVQDGVVTYGLSQAMRGDFDLLIDYYWEPKIASIETGGQQLELPLVLPSSPDETIEAIRMVTNVPESLTLASSEDWARVHSDQFSAAWSTTAIPQSLPLLLKHRLQSGVRRKPNLVIARSALAGDNFVTAVTAIYSEAPELSAFLLPEGCSVIQAAVGGEVAQWDIESEENGQTVVRIRPRSNSEGNGTTATLVVQQSVAGLPMMSLFHPQLPRPVNAEKDCNCVWVLRQAPDASLFHWSGSMSELTQPLRLSTAVSESQGQLPAIVDVLSPGQQSSREEVMSLLKQSLEEPHQHQLLVGSLLRQPQQVVMVSRRAMLLATAIIALLMYAAITRFHSVALITVAVLVAVSVTIVFAIVPGSAHSLLLRLIPGGVIAVIAGILQRWFAGQPASSARSVISPDDSTIFTVDQTMPSTTVHNPA